MREKNITWNRYIAPRKDETIPINGMMSQGRVENKKG